MTAGIRLKEEGNTNGARERAWGGPVQGRATGGWNNGCPAYGGHPGRHFPIVNRERSFISWGRLDLYSIHRPPNLLFISYLSHTYLIKIS